MDARELQEFYLSNYESKFWGPGSPLVPITTLKLNHFMHAHQVLKTPELCEFLEIYWFVDGISGEVKLPGEWNYCWFRGKYYHLEKTKSDGFLPNGDELEEWFFYTLVYDDWANEFLTNSVHVRGTISKTGDHKLVAQNLHLVSPLITEGNLVKFYNIEEQEKLIKTKDWGNDPTKVKEWDDQPTVYDFRVLQYLEGLASEILEPRESAAARLNGFIPFIYFQSLEGTLLRHLHRYVYENREGLRIYDVDRTKVLVNNFNTQFRRTGPLYAISRETDDVYHICKSINRGKRLKVENLRLNFVDTQWDRFQPLTPEFTPVHELGRFITKLGKINKKGEKEWWTNKAWHIAERVFRKLLDHGLLYTQQSPKEYDCRDFEKYVRNQEPKAWRLGNRVHTVEELKGLDWYNATKPYGAKGDGYFVGFDGEGWGDMSRAKLWNPGTYKNATDNNKFYFVYDKAKRNWLFRAFVFDFDAWTVSFVTNTKNPKYRQSVIGPLVSEWARVGHPNIPPPIFEPIYEDGDENLPGSWYDTVGVVFRRKLTTGWIPTKKKISKRLKHDERETIEFFVNGGDRSFDKYGVGRVSLIPEGDDPNVDLGWKNYIKEKNKWTEEEYKKKVTEWNKAVKEIAQGATFDSQDYQLDLDGYKKLVWTNNLIARGPLNEFILTNSGTDESRVPGFFMFSRRAHHYNLAHHFNFTKPLYELNVSEFRNERVADAIVADLIQQTQDNPVIIDTTDFVAFCSIRNLEWHFELLIKDNSLLVENATCLRQIILGDKTEARAADQEPTVDEVITALNSTNTLNIYGNDVPLRDRFIPDGSDLDWNFHLSVLEDKYQADSNYYVLELQSPESVIRTILETPKEAVFAVSQWSAHDKRDTLLSYVNAQQNRYYEKANLELERKKFNEEMATEERYKWWNRGTSLTGIIVGAIGAIAAVKATAATGGAAAAVGGALGGGLGASILSGIGNLTGWNQEDEERENRKRHFRESYEHKIKTMHNTQTEAQRAGLANIRNMANANTYGNTTNVVNFQGFNKHMKTTDIHLRQTRPTGVLLDKLRWYYREYGYDLTLPDQWCFGIDSIRGHLQYAQILENSHPDAAIRALIEARLLLGVRVVNLDGSPIGADEYPDSSLVASCLARYDQLKALHTQLETKVRDLENERGLIQEERDRLKGEVTDLTQSLSDKNADITGLRESIEAKTLEIKSKDDRIRDITNQLNAAKGGLTTFRKWEKSVKEAIGVELDTNPTNTINQIKQTKTDLEKARGDLKTAQDAKTAADTAHTKEREQWRETETQLNEAIRRVEGQKTQLEQTLNTERTQHTKALEAAEAKRTADLAAADRLKAQAQQEAQQAKDKAKTLETERDACRQSLASKTSEIEALKAQHLKDIEEAESRGKLTCEQFRALAGHHFYDLEDQELIADIEKLGVTLAVVVKYMLIFNVDQRFGPQHEFQPVFKDLYEIAENDLVEGFLEAFAADDWHASTIEKWKETEWTGSIPGITNRERAEAEREQMFLQYKDKNNDGRLFRGTDRDVVMAARVVRDDFDYSGQSESYSRIRHTALRNINPANLNQLKELLDDLSASLEIATMTYLIDVNTFDTGGRSERCIGVLPSTHCDEVNFVRLCYSWLRFYKRIWPTVPDTDVPYGVIMQGLTKQAQECNTPINFSVVNHVTKSTIYPAVGLYAFNPKWATWSVHGKTIRRGPLNHWLQVFEGYNSSKAYDAITPVIDNTAGLRIYKRGYNVTVKDTQYADLDWVYLKTKEKGKNPQIKDLYLSIEKVLLSDYYSAREKFFTRAVQHISQIFEGYNPQALTILTTRLRVVEDRRTKALDVIVDSPSLVERVNIDEVFGYETYKYALLHLLTMQLFRVRFKDYGKSYNGDYRVSKIEGIGFVINRPQPFEAWDSKRFVKYATDQLNKMATIYISPDFADAWDLFRWIHRNLKVWKDPTKGSNMEGLMNGLMSLSR